MARAVCVRPKVSSSLRSAGKVHHRWNIQLNCYGAKTDCSVCSKRAVV
jgi:hypothetical protein